MEGKGKPPFAASCTPCAHLYATYVTAALPFWGVCDALFDKLTDALQHGQYIADKGYVLEQVL